MDYKNGNLIRFLDDMIVTARSKVQAQLIIQIIAEFLAQRGLRLHPDKTAIVNIHDGFDYLGRHYQRKDGVLLVKPAGSSVKQVEQEL